MKLPEQFKSTSKLNIIRVVAFMLIIFIVPISIFFSKKESVSYDENRVLANAPKLNADSWFSKDYMSNVSSYLSDHFIIREQLVSFKNKTETAIGKNEINGILNVDGKLIEIFRNPDVSRRISNMKSINKYAEKSGTTPLFCLVPTAQQYYKKSLPFYAYASDEGEYITACNRALDSKKSINIIAALSSGNDDYLYYRTDHHWTENGAYNAYSAMQNYLGYTAFTKDMFDITVKSSDFQGTLYSKTLNNDVTKDNIISYTLKTGDPNTIITDENGKQISKSLYYPNRLKEKDKYSYFLGENKGVINVINKDSQLDNSLLLIKDSYANSIVPFLSKHFAKITVVDLRYANSEQLKKINSKSYTKSLILYNTIGFSTETTISKLKFMN